MQEIERLLNRSIKDFNPFPKLEEGFTLSELSLVLGINANELVANLGPKDTVKGLTNKFLEGFSGLLFQAVSLGEFQAFHLNDSTHVELLQFADVTMLIGEGSWTNIWSIKSFLRGFDMVSGLQMNLFKSTLFGINLDIDFLEETASFLSCRFG